MLFEIESYNDDEKLLDNDIILNNKSKIKPLFKEIIFRWLGINTHFNFLLYNLNGNYKSNNVLTKYKEKIIDISTLISYLNILNVIVNMYWYKSCRYLVLNDKSSKIYIVHTLIKEKHSKTFYITNERYKLYSIPKEFKVVDYKNKDLYLSNVDHC